jgi:XTP/dITP diphosphohydrolase
MKLLVATSNKHKIKEIKEILSPYEIEIVSPNEIGIAQEDIIEDGSTYKENALIKAKELAMKTNLPVIADDSGLEVKALDNKPGIHTARYAKELGGHLNAMKKIMGEIINRERDARFVCDIVLIDKDKKVHNFLGVCEGTIALEIKDKENSFGYDPFFIPSGYDKTFSELDEKEKNKISHRAKALRLLAKFLIKEID